MAVGTVWFRHSRWHQALLPPGFLRGTLPGQAGTLSLPYTLSPAPWRSPETTPSTNWPQRNTALKHREAEGKRHTWAFPVLRVEPRRPQASGHCTVSNTNGHSPHLRQSLISQRYFYTGVSNKKIPKSAILNSAL